jgi:hypothetical protein
MENLKKEYDKSVEEINEIFPKNIEKINYLMTN